MSNKSNTSTNKIITQLKGYNFNCKVEAITNGNHHGIKIFIPINSESAIKFDYEETLKGITRTFQWIDSIEYIEIPKVNQP